MKKLFLTFFVLSIILTSCEDQESRVSTKPIIRPPSPLVNKEAIVTVPSNKPELSSNPVKEQTVPVSVPITLPETAEQDTLCEDAPTIGVVITLHYKAGHSYVDCGGIGERCDWMPCHIPCVSFGNKCDWTITINLSLFNDGGNGKIELGKPYGGIVNLNQPYDQPIYPMPERSCLVQQNNSGGNGNSVNLNGLYANFKAQDFIQYEKKGLYKMTEGVFFTESPVFSNEH